MSTQIEHPSNRSTALIDRQQTTLQSLWEMADTHPDAEVMRNLVALAWEGDQALDNERQYHADTSRAKDDMLAESNNWIQRLNQEIATLINQGDSRQRIISDIAMQFDYTPDQAEMFLDFITGNSALQETMSQTALMDFNDAANETVIAMEDEQQFQSDMDAEYEAELDAERRRWDEAS